MTPKIKRSEDQLPLSPPVLYILLAVADESRHGYAIMQEVDRRTAGRVRLLPGSLYSTIKRMLAAGFIEECEGVANANFDDERRRYYGITSKGREVASAEVERMAMLVRLAADKDLAAAK